MEYLSELSALLSDGFTYFCDNYLVRVIICIAVTAVFYFLKCLISRIIASLIKKLLKRAKDSSNKREQALVKAIIPTVNILVMTAGLAVCLPILSPPDALYTVIVKVIQSLILIALFSLGYGFAGYSRYPIERRLDESKHYSKLTADFTVGLLKVTAILFGTLAVLGQWVDNLSSLLAGVSIGGAAIALAAQDTASNFFGAITVMFDHPFDAGDYIEIDGEAGSVEVMGLRSTRLRRSDRSVVIVPNAKMASENIVNWSRTDSRRVELTFGLEYSETHKKLDEFMCGIKELLTKNDGVKSDSVLVVFNGYGKYALELYVKYLTRANDYNGMMETKNTVNMQILCLAEKLGIEFAYPLKYERAENNK